MYKIEKTSYGLRATMEGVTDVPEAKAYAQEFLAILETCEPNFGFFADLRTAKPLSPEAEKEKMTAYRKMMLKGLCRMAVIVPSEIMKMQATRAAKGIEAYSYMRYIDASTDPNWEQTALDWLIKGVDPDL